MAPQWFSIPSELIPSGSATLDASSSTLLPIPFDRMWADDRIWFPYLLQETFFYGRVDFGKSPVEGGECVFERWWFGRKP